MAEMTLWPALHFVPKTNGGAENIVFPRGSGHREKGIGSGTREFKCS